MTTMFEWLNEAIKSLNDYTGLLSLLAMIAAIIVPYCIYKKERNDRSNAERQAMQDELEAIDQNSRFPMSIEAREYFTKKHILEKRLDRK